MSSENPESGAPPTNAGPASAASVAASPTDDPPSKSSTELPLNRGFGERALRWIGNFFVRLGRGAVYYFTHNKPTFLTALLPFLVFTVVVYVRWPATNYIFDEQEALLANPYVNQQGWNYEDAIYRDFWGLPPNGSIGSYRPIPNYLWRGVVEMGERLQPAFDKIISPETQKSFNPPMERLTEFGRRSFLQHFWNLFFHAVNGALFTAMAWRYTRKRFFSWMAGAVFLSAAILTEAVCGCVGIADVLGGLGALLALASLGLRAYAMPFGVFLSMLIGLYSKESAVVCVPLIPVAALLTAPVIHPDKPARVIRTVLALVGTVAAFILYVETRKLWFPSPLSSEYAQELPEWATKSQTLVRDFMVWFHQPPLPHDPLNNPLADDMITYEQRVGGALRVYERGLGQVVFPWSLSGDYSFPQEPAPDKLVFPASVLGMLMTIIPLGTALGLFVTSVVREWRGPRVPIEDIEEPPSLYRRVGVHALEVALVVVSVLLVRKMLAIPPAKEFESAGDIIGYALTPEQMRTWGLRIASGALVIGGLTEAFWRVKTRATNLWASSLVALGCVWLVVSYFPHSNIPALLPTVRAERLWYFPVLGTTMIISVALYFIVRRLRELRWKRLAIAIPAAFLGFQTLRAFWHAHDYRDDLAFWDATKDAVPNSSKAHLNYSVMVGARGRMAERLEHSKRAMELAPDWAMAHIYTGDTICRMAGQLGTEYEKRRIAAEESWPYYRDGFRKGPNDKGLISLALQCLWDERILKGHETELREIADENPGSWIAYLAIDTLNNGDKNNGVDPQYRPRSYNEGPKKDKGDSTESTESTDTSSSDVEPSGEAITPDETKPSGSAVQSGSATMGASQTRPSAALKSTSSAK
ncbi:MAG: tetratricopeptide repeat protein [Polyangiaceae bacterium]